VNAGNYFEVLRSNLPRSALKLATNDSYQFKQGNDPKHNAKKTREWLLYNVRRRRISPPQSPDINPIENLWHLLDLELKKISSKSDLKRVISEEWLKIPEETTTNLVETMPRRLQAVTDANVMHTKY
jgi:hypothetical protein